ncbi:HigA family addiction module antitoxin [Desulfurobacterium sp. TC5-1]|uniref:HigA family addiction module antitoxin n=1 Tax=Desulfurobacterium sp. TC5-1 TaxID=1158318 RepID=UPI0003B707AF|nr:HigA family addiction module antitoxin [Desulfurobacterium sp. TC5-1]
MKKKTYNFVPLFEREIPPVHPGEILLEEFLRPLNMTQSELAKKLNVSFRTINDLINEKRGISPEMAIKLANFFGTTPQFWMNFQRDYDLWKAHNKMGEKKAG